MDRIHCRMPRYTPNNPTTMNAHSMVTGEIMSRPMSWRSMYSLIWKLRNGACASRRTKPSRNSAPPASAKNSQRLTLMPGVSQRIACDQAWRPELFSRIAKLHERAHVMGAQMSGQLGRQIHGTMAAAGAADADRQVRLAFADEQRDEEVDEAVELAFERLDVRIALEKLDHGRMRAGERAQLVDVVGIGKKARVEDQIGVQRHAVLVTESHHRDGEHAGLGGRIGGMRQALLERGQRQG